MNSTNTSNCCNAPIIENTDLCSQCKEHCNEVKTTFKITEINPIRRQRGTEYIRVSIFENGVEVYWLWMNEKHIELNKKEHGKDSFLNSTEDFI